MSKKVRVLVWDENPSHRSMEIYPNSLNAAIAAGLNELDTKGELEVSIACLDDENQGVTQEVLDNTDVLIWWGHARHGEVNDEIATMVKNQVHTKGMGFICLHSGHYSKTFKAVLNCTGMRTMAPDHGWREQLCDRCRRDVRIAIRHASATHQHFSVALFDWKRIVPERNDVDRRRRYRS
jgi:trehalose utilization protein